MVTNRSKDTSPELAIRSGLHRKGYRYRVHIRPIPELRRTADIAFTRLEMAVFVDGCFWHGCPAHFVPPKQDSDYWAHKITSNRLRDQSTDAALKESGWTVLRVWEH